MKRETFFTFLYVGLIIGLILFMIFLVFWLKSESAMCLKDPLQFYMEKSGENCYCVNNWINP